ncbi:aspartate aminotransferase, cytoplasmic-like isoform X2 [Liolophura sinensis]|uniref:aspartate aminotransferase, cytoplasmic-like isoform X2 n=1 Tax=Liolophura sinensis TaxID=3198878 RepID=UPI003158CEE0
MFNSLAVNDGLMPKLGEARILSAQFKTDPFPRKVDLGAGVYKDETGKPWVFPVVRKVERMMANESFNTPVEPFQNFAFEEEARSFLLGRNSAAVHEKRVCSIQSVGGTGALRLAAEFCLRSMHLDTVYIPEFSWANHEGIFHQVGFCVKKYRYWSTQKQCLDLSGLLADVKKANKGSVIIFHACSHNPTGTDPSLDEWREIAELCQTVGLFVIIDCAYQSFASGHTERDAQAVRQFVDLNTEFMVAQSFSKNFGLYNERVGNLCVITGQSGGAMAANIRAHLVSLAGDLGLIPSHHGAAIVTQILQDVQLYQEWRENVETAIKRLGEVRRGLYQKLTDLQTPGHWERMLQQRGMFAFVGINAAQVKSLRELYHVYLLRNGRMCLAGLNESNVDYVAEALRDVVQNVSDDARL